MITNFKIFEEWSTFSKTKYEEYSIEYIADYSRSRSTLFGICFAVVFIDGYSSDITAIFNYDDYTCHINYNGFRSDKISDPKKLYSDILLEVEKRNFKEYDKFITSFKNQFTYDNFVKEIIQNKSDDSISDITKSISVLTKKLRDNKDEEFKTVSLWIKSDSFDSNDDEFTKKLKIIKKERELIEKELDIKKSKLNSK